MVTVRLREQGRTASGTVERGGAGKGICRTCAVPGQVAETLAQRHTHRGRYSAVDAHRKHRELIFRTDRRNRRLDATQHPRFSEIQIFTSAPDELAQSTPPLHPKFSPISPPPIRPTGAAIPDTQRLRLGAFLGHLGCLLHRQNPL